MININYQKWINHTFSSSSSAEKDYLTFQQEMRQDLKNQASKYNLLLHSFNKNHYCFSAVLKDKNENKYIYVSMSDVRGIGKKLFNSVLYRTMQNEKDWTGGNNHFCNWDSVGEKARELIEWSKKKELSIKQNNEELEIER